MGLGGGGKRGRGEGGVGGRETKVGVGVGVERALHDTGSKSDFQIGPRQRRPPGGKLPLICMAWPSRAWKDLTSELHWNTQQR